MTVQLNFAPVPQTESRRLWSDPVWHVSSRSGVATLRTAVHLLLTYLLANGCWCACATVQLSAWQLSATAPSVPAATQRASSSPTASASRPSSSTPTSGCCRTAVWRPSTTRAASSCRCAFQFWHEGFDSIPFSLPNRFFSIRFGSLINLPLVH